MIASDDTLKSPAELRPPPLVVCVDDEARVLAALQRILRQEPYETIAIEQPRDVLDLLERRPVSLVVADQRMPSMTGTQLLKEVRERSPGTIGVILSGHADSGEISSAIQEGTVGCFIWKPWEETDFRTVIRQLLCLPPTPAPKRPGAAPRARRHGKRPTLQLDCSALGVNEALAEYSNLLAAPEVHLCGAVLVLKNLSKLEGSFSAFLDGVLDGVSGIEAPVALLEESGLAEDFFTLFGGDSSAVVFRTPEDLPRRRRLLLVGEGSEIALLRRRLESAGHACRSVGSPTQAIRRMLLTPFDTVLLGEVLPDPAGVALARRVLARLFEVPILTITNHEGIRDLLERLKTC